MMPALTLGRLAPAPGRARAPALTITASHAATLAPGAARRQEDATSLLQKALSSAAGFSVSDPDNRLHTITCPARRGVPPLWLHLPLCALSIITYGPRRPLGPALWQAAGTLHSFCPDFPHTLIGGRFLTRRPALRQVGDVLGQRITGDVWNPTRSLELGAFGFLMDGPLRHLLSQLNRESAAAELAGKVKSSVSSALDGKAWVPMLACVAVAALKAADGDPAALVHSCEVRLLWIDSCRGVLVQSVRHACIRVTYLFYATVQALASALFLFCLLCRSVPALSQS